MNYLLLLLSCLFNGLKSVYAKKSGACLTEAHNIYTYNFYMFVISFVIAVCYGIPTWTGVSLTAAGIGILYGVTLIFAQVFLIKAIDLGGVAISSLFYACGFLLPSFMGVLFYDESVSLPQLIGVALILLSFVITSSKGERPTAKWFLMVFAALFFNGAAGMTQKVFRMSAHGGEMSAFMIISFLVGGIIAFLLMPKTPLSALPSKKFFRTVAVSGLAMGLVNMINVYISGVLPSIVMFPSVNGGGIIASAILARFLVGERISRKKILGIAVGILAMCLIAL